MSLKRLVTIGYEGADPADFLATLELVGVTTLLDIREMAISRRYGFAKNALREGLASVGIDYRHEPRLGSPKAIRHQLRDDGDYPRFFRDFERYLKTQGDLLEALAEELTGTVALLCYERDYTQCHRRAVADAFSKITGIKPKHQGVQGHAQRQAAARARAHPWSRRTRSLAGPTRRRSVSRPSAKTAATCCGCSRSATATCPRIASSIASI